MLIRKSEEADFPAMLDIINEAAHAYRGVIPADRWHEPYMLPDELVREMAAGVVFWVAEEDGRVSGVMGIQDKGDVALVRHAYVAPTTQRSGVGTGLLRHVEALTDKPILIGTWAAASWAIDFYRRNGFTLVSPADKDRLLQTYWSIPARQIETSVVLGNRRWLEAKREPAPGVLGAIGNTPLIELNTIVPQAGRILAKLEWANPTGSMKDRMARAAIEAAEARGELQAGGTVVEYTAGTTGISLALVCAAKGYGLTIVFSDAFSAEKRRTMEAFGARIIDVPSDHGRITEQLIKEMIATAGRLSREPGHWWCDQLNNRDAMAGYFPMGEEIWSQTGGRVDAFVHAVSTAHSLHGVTKALHAHKSDVHIVAVEPAESAVLSGGPSGAHKIEGIGIGFIPPLWEPEEVDEIVAVSTEDAKAMCRRLAREEGVLAGTSSGANLVAAIRVAERLGPAATVVTVMVDSGLRYLSTDLYQRV